MAFFDCGLDYPETYAYLTNLAQAWKVGPARIPTDPPPLDVLAASGLWDHTAPTHAAAARVDLHQVLITEPARRAHALLGPGELWDVRADESAAHRHLYTRGGRRDGIITRGDVDAPAVPRRPPRRPSSRCTTAYGPIWNWPPPTSGRTLPGIGCR